MHASWRTKPQLQCRLPCPTAAAGGRSSLLAAPWPASGGRRRRLCCGGATSSSSEKEEEVELVRRGKAQEALRRRLEELDAQLQELSEPKKRPLPPTPPPLEPYLDRATITGREADELPEFSPSYIAYSAVALVFLTIFTNVIFNLYIKPSVDGYEQQAVKIQRVPLVNPAERQFP